MALPGLSNLHLGPKGMRHKLKVSTSPPHITSPHITFLPNNVLGLIGAHLSTNNLARLSLTSQSMYKAHLLNILRRQYKLNVKNANALLAPNFKLPRNTVNNVLRKAKEGKYDPVYKHIVEGKSKAGSIQYFVRIISQHSDTGTAFPKKGTAFPKRIQVSNGRRHPSLLVKFLNNKSAPNHYVMKNRNGKTVTSAIERAVILKALGLNYNKNVQVDHRYKWRVIKQKY